LPSKGFDMVRQRMREAQGLTQQAWAEKAGVTGDSIPRLETGVWKNPTSATLNPGVCRRLHAWREGGIDA
jgi:predicted transcriptional regulator